jgi:hypothetical protein
VQRHWIVNGRRHVALLEVLAERVALGGAHDELVIDVPRTRDFMR